MKRRYTHYHLPAYLLYLSVYLPLSIIYLQILTKQMWQNVHDQRMLVSGNDGTQIFVLFLQLFSQYEILPKLEGFCKVLTQCGSMYLYWPESSGLLISVWHLIQTPETLHCLELPSTFLVTTPAILLPTHSSEREENPFKIVLCIKTKYKLKTTTFLVSFLYLKKSYIINTENQEKI